jgi:hypothetical protein
MTDRTTSDLAALLTPAPSAGVQFSQGRVLTWDNENLANTIEWRGITIRDIPLVEGINALVIRPGDIVGMLGWAPEKSKGVGSWWILGKLSNPGEKVADLSITAKLIRFITENGDTLAFFGKESDGDPAWILYYGEADNQAAIRIVNNDYVSITDRSGHEVLATDGATQVGLSRPYLHYHLAPTVNAVINGTVFVPSTSSAAYVPVYEGRPYVWHPQVTYDVGISATGVTDWRLLANGTVVFTGSPSASGTFAIPGWGTTVLPGHIVTFTLEARNTGAGFTRVMVRRFEGRQS